MTDARKTKTTGFALVLIGFGGWILFPHPLVITIPLLILGRVHLFWLAIFVPTALFFLWNPGLLKGQTRVPIRSLVLLAALTALTAVYFAESWAYGLLYQGLQYTRGICAANVVWLLILWAVFILGRSKASFSRNLLAHF